MKTKNIVLCLIFTFISKTLLATDQPANTIELGFSRLNNIWNFIGNADINLNSSFGNFHLKNIYKGIAVDNIDNSFRDAENFNFNYNYPINKKIFIEAETNIIFLTDMSAALNDNLLRRSTLTGLLAKDENIGSLRFLAGIENNKQVDFQANGFIFKSDGKLDEYDINNYKLNASLNAEFLFLNDNRQSKDLDISSTISKLFNNQDLLFAGLRYKLQGRDFLQTIKIDGITPIESNNENRIEGNVKTKLDIYEKTFINIEGIFGNISTTRNFNHSLPENKNSFIDRNYNELNFGLNLDLDYTIGNVLQNFGAQVAYRNEKNYIKEKYQISSIDFINLQNFETQKDNISSNIKLFYKNLWTISAKDTMQASVSLAKLEYDTPSNQNNDDRDELVLFATIKYFRRLSDILLTHFALNYNQNHIVFLKKERSGQNNWNRILNLQAGIDFDNGFMQYFPRFAILANYTIYDFESIDKGVRSYSFRQISYKDTLTINLTESYYLTNLASIRLYEQGRLYWSSFSEVPQQRNLEISAMPKFNYEVNKLFKIGIGCRLFWLKYGQISTKNELINAQKITTYSPDFYIKCNLNKIFFNCFGWLEYKYINQARLEMQPNLFLSTSYRF